nr:hypothetical protein [uncultured Brevundimonas sp.]
MTTTAPMTNAPPPKWAMFGIGLGAFAAVLIGAFAVEPALHYLMTARPTEAPLARRGQVVVGETLLSGRYNAAEGGRSLQAEGAALVMDNGKRLTSAPHRLVAADEKATATSTFAGVMAVPDQAQIEVRRVVSDEGSRLCDGQSVGWLAFAVRQDGFALLPVLQGPPPGALLAEERLCSLQDFKH